MKWVSYYQCEDKNSSAAVRLYVLFFFFFVAHEFKKELKSNKSCVAPLVNLRAPSATMLRSDHSTWKVTVDTLDLPPHTLKPTHVCFTLLLAELFYRAIYSSVSCLICFVWRKVNLEIEANWRHFKWSQADGSTTAELYISLALQLLSAVHSLLH